ncbi:putative Mg2+ transporter-C (MgtC) family protein [Devosia enhydra]|uniref:Protein MgtC n=1 Tax=Devosia enhydra TaxID=665118 RepID=A0A1K2HW45_9HYPH|nr:MgtC/SapB family protein [Devosia enhydra]SFZ83151.1 putative Mg2+ transporter-C (MgtC) family protein [Devosia enhydra]
MDWAAELGFARTYMSEQVILVRLGVAAILGGVIGYEREANSGGAGLRTHILVSVAAALFTILAFEIYYLGSATDAGRVDPIRAVEAVTAGIAFLGAGAIFRGQGSVRGLTTGAGMWLAGAVGVASALGFYIIAAAVAAFALIVLGLLKAFSHKIVGRDHPHHDREREHDL